MPAVAPRLHKLPRHDRRHSFANRRFLDGESWFFDHTRSVVPVGSSAVLAELAATAYRLGRRYTAIPFMSLVASEAALRRLGESTNVLDVQEDRASSPLPSVEPAR